MAICYGAQREWQRWSAILIFVPLRVSDGVDGYIARRYSQRSQLGVTRSVGGQRAASCRSLPCRSAIGVTNSALVSGSRHARDVIVLAGARSPAISQWLRSSQTKLDGESGYGLATIAIGLAMLQLNFSPTVWLFASSASLLLSLFRWSLRACLRPFPDSGIVDGLAQLQAKGHGVEAVVGPLKSRARAYRSDCWAAECRQIRALQSPRRPEDLHRPRYVWRNSRPHCDRMHSRHQAFTIIDMEAWQRCRHELHRQVRAEATRGCYFNSFSSSWMERTGFADRSRTSASAPARRKARAARSQQNRRGPACAEGRRIQPAGVRR